MAPLELPRALSTALDHGVYRLSTISTSGSIYFPIPPLLFPDIIDSDVRLTPVSTIIVLSMNFTPFCGLGGP